MVIRQFVAMVVNTMIGDDHHRRCERITPIELKQKHAEDQHEFDQRRHAGQHDQPHDGLDGVAAALQDARQAAGLALEMEAQRQPVHVDEDVVGEPPHRVHRNGGEQPVTQLREERHEDAQKPVKNRQRDRTGEQRRQSESCPCSPVSASVAHLNE